jgi:glycine cleavage system H protein
MHGKVAVFPGGLSNPFARSVSDRVAQGLFLLAGLTLACGHPAAAPQNAQSQDGAKPSASKRQDPTWENIRRIIAQRLNVPEEKVVPSARFDDDLNVAEPDMEDMVEAFDDAFGTESEPDDAGILVTVEDAIDYVKDPVTFRKEHAGRDTYSDVDNPYPTDVKYSKLHQWVKVEGDKASIGVTYAFQQRYALGSVHLPQVGEKLAAGDTYATIEAGMAGVLLNAPLSGAVVEVNKELAASGRSIRKNPYSAWIIKVRLADPKELDALLSAADYAKFVNAGH